VQHAPGSPHPPLTSSLLGWEVFLRALFSNIHRLPSALNIRGKISHACDSTCLITHSDRCKELTLMKVVMTTKA
jgi:hypothetical protein